MQRSIVLALLGFLLAAPAMFAQESENHVQVGVFADYFNLSRTSPHINFVGVGGRAAFNVRSNVQIEAEMAYDFTRNFTTTFSDGVNTRFVSTDLRTCMRCSARSSAPAADRFVCSEPSKPA